jgi:uncharacterized damage-inducible protein DinB
MDYYSARELAASFRTVRGNTIIVAQEIPDEQYSFRATPAVRSVAEMLAHVACNTAWMHQLHGVDRKTFVSFEDFGGYMQKLQQAQEQLTTKTAILDALRTEGERFAGWLEGLSDATLAERVGFPQPVDPPSKTRFEMLLSAKEHEMHHRAQLMLIQRLLGQVPHLTRRREEQMAAAGRT